MYYVKDSKDLNWIVVVKIKPRDWYDILEKVINEVCQENEEIDSILYAFNALDNEHEFSLDKNDLA